MRMLQRELEREEDRSRKKRKETKHTYAAKVKFGTGNAFCIFTDLNT